MLTADSRLSKNSRLYLLGAFMLFWLVAICGRLIYLQVFSYGKFVKQAGHQQQRAIPVAAKRGVIYDRAGRELAMSVMVDSAFAVPTEVKENTKKDVNMEDISIKDSIEDISINHSVEKDSIKDNVD